MTGRGDPWAQQKVRGGRDRPPDRRNLLRDQRQLGGHPAELRRGPRPARRRRQGEEGGVYDQGRIYEAFTVVGA